MPKTNQSPNQSTNPSQATSDELALAVRRRAMGCETVEIVEEFAVDADGGVVLTKRRVITKHLGPDIAAAKLLLELGQPQDRLHSMTDQELAQHKQRLLALLGQNQTNQRSKK